MDKFNKIIQDIAYLKSWEEKGKDHINALIFNILSIMAQTITNSTDKDMSFTYSKDHTVHFTKKWGLNLSSRTHTLYSSEKGLNIDLAETFIFLSSLNEIFSKIRIKLIDDLIEDVIEELDKSAA